MHPAVRSPHFLIRCAGPAGRKRSYKPVLTDNGSRSLGEPRKLQGKTEEAGSGRTIPESVVSLSIGTRGGKLRKDLNVRYGWI